ncbi:MAG: hypothetical protein JSS21_10160 [Proteobacteria bacterium]|nr:hypothetical protein [Pseudomonadota bacterium]
MTKMMTLQLDESVMDRLTAVARTHHCTAEMLAVQVLDDLLPCAADIAVEGEADWSPAGFVLLNDAA